MGRKAMRFHEFIGQKRVVSHLKRLVRGAKILGEPCESLLLVGAAGCGKTSIAKAVAAEYGTEFHYLLASSDTKPSEICDQLRKVKHGDIFFIDEGHALSRDAQLILHLALDDLRIPVATERGIDRCEYESVAAFTLIIATNEPGRLKQATRSRLTRTEFARYTSQELREIAESIAQKLGIRVSPQGANLIAKVSQGSPRMIERRIHSLRHFFPENKYFVKEQVRAYLASAGVDERGFTLHQRYYLCQLAEAPKRRSTLERLAIKLGCDTTDVRQEVEPFLIDSGLVDISNQNRRKLTQQGIQVAEEISHSRQTEEELHDVECSYR